MVEHCARESARIILVLVFHHFHSVLTVSFLGTSTRVPSYFCCTYVKDPKQPGEKRPARFIPKPSARVQDDCIKWGHGNTTKSFIYVSGMGYVMHVVKHICVHTASITFIVSSATTVTSRTTDEHAFRTSIHKNHKEVLKR